MKNRSDSSFKLSPNHCGIPGCEMQPYEDNYCRGHYRMLLDPKVRLAVEDMKRREYLDRATAKPGR